MKFNVLKTRLGRLEQKITLALAKPKPDIKEIISAVESYEQDNLDTIEKLRKERQYESRKISGALKQCIGSHGPITKLLIGSATKRIMGMVLVPTPTKSTFKETHWDRIIKVVMCLFGVALIVYLLLKFVL